MKNLFLLVAVTSFCSTVLGRSVCFEKSPSKVWRGKQDYSVTFKENLKLDKNHSGNYSKRIPHQRVFGCTIFSILPELKGTFKAIGGSLLSSKCEGKTDYAFMQFADESGKPTFRIQCEQVAYEDQESKKFVPGSKDVQELFGTIIEVN